ncbi:unnamed protein product, partial [Ectocarpus sp. 12 AP-2014]
HRARHTHGPPFLLLLFLGVGTAPAPSAVTAAPGGPVTPQNPGATISVPYRRETEPARGERQEASEPSGRRLGTAQRHTSPPNNLVSTTCSRAAGAIDVGCAIDDGGVVPAEPGSSIGPRPLLETRGLGPRRGSGGRHRQYPDHR